MLSLWIPAFLDETADAIHEILAAAFVQDEPAHGLKVHAADPSDVLGADSSKVRAQNLVPLVVGPERTHVSSSHLNLCKTVEIILLRKLSQRIHPVIFIHFVLRELAEERGVPPPVGIDHDRSPAASAPQLFSHSGIVSIQPDAADEVEVSALRLDHLSRGVRQSLQHLRQLQVFGRRRELWNVKDDPVEDEVSGRGTDVGHKLADFRPRVILIHPQVLDVDGQPGCLA